MAHYTTDSDTEENDEVDDERVPEGVIRGMEDIAEGRTATKRELIEASKPD